jgi:hypothetical protein
MWFSITMESWDGSRESCFLSCCFFILSYLLLYNIIPYNICSGLASHHSVPNISCSCSQCSMTSSVSAQETLGLFSSSSHRRVTLNKEAGICVLRRRREALEIVISCLSLVFRGLSQSFFLSVYLSTGRDSRVNQRNVKRSKDGQTLSPLTLKEYHDQERRL